MYNKTLTFRSSPIINNYYNEILYNNIIVNLNF